MCGVQFDDIGTRSGSAGLPLPGFDLCVLDPKTGAELRPGEMGSIALRQPLPPGFMATIFNDDERFKEAYMSEFPGFYASGDSGYRDQDGYVHVMARTDDVLNVAGHRLSTGQLEEACLLHPSVVGKSPYCARGRA